MLAKVLPEFPADCPPKKPPGVPGRLLKSSGFFVGRVMPFPVNPALPNVRTPAVRTESLPSRSRPGAFRMTRMFGDISCKPSPKIRCSISRGRRSQNSRDSSQVHPLFRCAHESLGMYQPIRADASRLHQEAVWMESVGNGAKNVPDIVCSPGRPRLSDLNSYWPLLSLPPPFADFRVVARISVQKLGQIQARAHEASALRCPWQLAERFLGVLLLQLRKKALAGVAECPWLGYIRVPRCGSRRRFFQVLPEIGSAFSGLRAGFFFPMATTDQTTTKQKPARMARI